MIQGTSGSSQEEAGIPPAQRLFTKCSKEQPLTHSQIPVPAGPGGRPLPGMENNRPQRRACPRQQPVTKGRAHRAGNPRKEGDHPRLPTKPPHLIPCG